MKKKEAKPLRQKLAEAVNKILKSDTQGLNRKMENLVQKSVKRIAKRSEKRMAKSNKK